MHQGELKKYSSSVFLMKRCHVCFNTEKWWYYEILEFIIKVKIYWELKNLKLNSTFLRLILYNEEAN